jgi:hypothetical protein
VRVGVGRECRAYPIFVDHIAGQVVGRNTGVGGDKIGDRGEVLPVGLEGRLRWLTRAAVDEELIEPDLLRRWGIAWRQRLDGHFAGLDLEDSAHGPCYRWSKCCPHCRQWGRHWRRPTVQRYGPDSLIGLVEQGPDPFGKHEVVVAGAGCDHRPHQGGVVDDEVDDDGTIVEGSCPGDGGFEVGLVFTAQGYAAECLGEKDKVGDASGVGGEVGISNSGLDSGRVGVGGPYRGCRC